MKAFALRPIGVFDSGVGGLSVLRALHAEMPWERFIYVGDSGHAPYGERDDGHVASRSHAIADYLIGTHQIKALVVACNTATAAAIKDLRRRYPNLTVVGIEPALKPAAAASQTKRVGVMATRGTLNSSKFQSLLASQQGQATFVLQPCDGLAAAIEAQDAGEIQALCAGYTRNMGQFGTDLGQMDALVLGCTHYPFIEAILRAQIATPILFFEGGAPVARQTHRLLQAAHQLAPESPSDFTSTTYFSTGHELDLQKAVWRWLHCKAAVNTLSV